MVLPSLSPKLSALYVAIYQHSILFIPNLKSSLYVYDESCISISSLHFISDVFLPCTSMLNSSMV